MSAKIIPNAFQSPNSYVDDAMELLTGEEYKCLSFAARHILGWQDKINTRQGVISLSMFEHGYDAAGTHYGGTGVHRAALITALAALVKYGLLVKLGDPTPDGQRWQLGDAPDFDGLRQRRDEQAQARRDRTRKASETRRAIAGSSDEPVRGTNQRRFVGRTDAGSSDELNQNQSKPPQNQRDARANIFTLYEAVFGIIPPTVVDDLKDAEREFSADWIDDAFKLTRKNGGRSWKYTRAILEGWRTNGRGVPPKQPRKSDTKHGAPEQVAPGLEEED